MNISTKIFSLCLSIMTLISTPCIASYDTVFFHLRHVEAGSDLRTPNVGDIELKIHIFKVEGAHQIQIDDLMLGKMYQDHVKEVPIICPNITGDYYFIATCYGKGKFANQNASIEKTFTLKRGTRVIDISYACPTNQFGTVISAPEERLFIQK